MNNTIEQIFKEKDCVIRSAIITPPHHKNNFYKGEIIYETSITKPTSKKITSLEEKVLNHLCDAWNTYLQLEKDEGRQHSSDIDDFCNGIHKCQNVIAMRVARKVEPDIFPIKL